MQKQEQDLAAKAHGRMMRFLAFSLMSLYLVQELLLRTKEQDLATKAHGCMDVIPGLVSHATHRRKRSKTSPWSRRKVPPGWRPREPQRWLHKGFA